MLQAERCLQQALAIARRQQAKFLELRAAQRITSVAWKSRDGGTVRPRAWAT
jgi:hypothetical protein